MRPAERSRYRRYILRFLLHLISYWYAFVQVLTHEPAVVGNSKMKKNHPTASDMIMTRNEQNNFQGRRYHVWNLFVRDACFQINLPYPQRWVLKIHSKFPHLEPACYMTDPTLKPWSITSIGKTAKSVGLYRWDVVMVTVARITFTRPHVTF